MEIGVILENIAGLIGLLFRLGMAAILMAFKGVLLVALVCVAILPFLSRRRSMCAAGANEPARRRPGKKRRRRGVVLQKASPAVPPPWCDSSRPA